MGSSFVEFKGKGFWVNDVRLAVWLRCLVREIDSMPEPPSWLLDQKEFWDMNATWCPIGCMDAGIEQLTGDEKQIILALSEKAVDQLEVHGEYISGKELNEMQIGSGFWMEDEKVETEKFRSVGLHFIKLLRGEITTDVSTSRRIR